MTHLRPLSGKEMITGFEKRIAREEGRPNPVFKVLALEEEMLLARAGGRRNLVRNARHRVNQRNAVSGVSLAPRTYCLDGVRAGGLVNLVPNPGAEVDTSGWFANAAAVTRSTAWSDSGAASFQVVASGAESYLGLSSQIWLPGRTYTFIAVARLTAALTGAVSTTAERRLYAVDTTSGTVILGQSAQFANAAGVTRLAVTFTVPETVTNLAAVGIRLYLGRAAGTVWFDSIMLIEGDYTPNLPAFFATTSRANTALTWVTNVDGSRTLTVPGGGQAIYPVERLDIVAGDYVLAWGGTATGRAYGEGSVEPAYGAAPQILTLDGTRNALVDFTGGTVEWVALVRAEDWSGYFPDLPMAEELLWCKRFFQAFAVGDVQVFNPYFTVALGGGGQYIDAVMTEMRATPIIRRSDGTIGLHSFTYLPSNASSNTSRNVSLTGFSPRRLSGGYSSSDNGGSTLAAIYGMGSSNNPIWLDSEL